MQNYLIGDHGDIIKTPHFKKRRRKKPEVELNDIPMDIDERRN